MWEPFTADCREMICEAQRISINAKRNCITSGAIVLAAWKIICLSSRLLPLKNALNIISQKFEEVACLVEDNSTQDEEFNIHSIYFSPKAKKIIEDIFRVSREYTHNNIDVVHVILLSLEEGFSLHNNLYGEVKNKKRFFKSVCDVISKISVPAMMPDKVETLKKKKVIQKPESEKMVDFLPDQFIDEMLESMVLAAKFGPDLLVKLCNDGEIVLDKEVRMKLLQLSNHFERAATVIKIIATTFAAKIKKSTKKS